jgi:hypothetical protein
MAKDETKPAAAKDPQLSDTDWFPHDQDSSSDPKLAALLDDFAAAGYGVFWHIVEQMHKEPDGYLPLKSYIYKGVAKNMKTSADLVEKIVLLCLSEYELFTELEGKFTSDRVQSNKRRKDFIVEKRKAAGQKGGLAKAANCSKPVANAKQVLASAKQPLANAQQNVADKIRLDKIHSYLIESNIQLLQDSTGGTQTGERLLGAFLSAYPRRLPEDLTNDLHKIWKTFELEKCAQIIQNLAIDIRHPDEDFFEDPMQYVIENAE